MRLMRCQHPFIAVHGSQASVSMGAGAIVDVDQIVAPDRTLADELGDYLSGFESVEPEGDSVRAGLAPGEIVINAALAARPAAEAQE